MFTATCVLEPVVRRHRLRMDRRKRPRRASRDKVQEVIACSTLTDLPLHDAANTNLNIVVSSSALRRTGASDATPLLGLKLAVGDASSPAQEGAYQLQYQDLLRQKIRASWELRQHDHQPAGPGRGDIPRLGLGCTEVLSVPTIETCEWLSEESK